MRPVDDERTPEQEEADARMDALDLDDVHDDAWWYERDRAFWRVRCSGGKDAR